jgi:hypothetical protein
MKAINYLFSHQQQDSTVVFCIKVLTLQELYSKIREKSERVPVHKAAVISEWD